MNIFILRIKCRTFFISLQVLFVYKSENIENVLLKLIQLPSRKLLTRKRIDFPRENPHLCRVMCIENG